LREDLGLNMFALNPLNC